MLIEPTECESLKELDRFADAMITIRGEIQEIIDGKQSKDDNILKNAPHPLRRLLETEWDKPYSRERAAYPDPKLKLNKVRFEYFSVSKPLIRTAVLAKRRQTTRILRRPQS